MKQRISESKSDILVKVEELKHRLAIDNPNLSSKINLFTLSKMIEMIF